MTTDKGTSAPGLLGPVGWKQGAAALLSVLAVAFGLSFLAAIGHYRLALAASMAVLTFGFGVGAPRLARFSAFAALGLVQFAMLVPSLRPTEVNYLVYTALLALGVLVAGTFVRQYRASVTTAFFAYLLVSATLFFGAGLLAAQYQVLVFPLMALCYHELALRADGREIRVLLAGFLAFVGVEAALGIMQSLVGWPLFFFQEAMVSPRNPIGYLLSSVSISVRQGLGTFAHFNGLGSLLALALPIAFGLAIRRRTTLGWVYFGLVAAGVFATFSRGAWLGSLVGVTAILLTEGTSKRKVGMFAAAGLLATLLLSLGSSYTFAYYSSTQNLTARTASWRVAADELRVQPSKALFGFGYSYYSETADTDLQGTKAMSRLHSWVVQATFELGIVGLILLLLTVLPPPIRALRHKGDYLQVAIAASVMSFLASQLFDNSLFGATGVFMFALLGVLRRLQRPGGSESAHQDLAL